MWISYFNSLFPGSRVVCVESYREKALPRNTGQGSRKHYEPYIPTELKQNLVNALKEAHKELIAPPPSIQGDPVKLASWTPRVKSSVDWDAVLNAKDGDVRFEHPAAHVPTIDREGDEDKSARTAPPDYLSIGVLGML